jgi:hypothetical protein
MRADNKAMRAVIGAADAVDVGREKLVRMDKKLRNRNIHSRGPTTPLLRMKKANHSRVQMENVAVEIDAVTAEAALASLRLTGLQRPLASPAA